MRILTVFGTRPEAIKMAPIIKKLLADSFFETKVCVTAQHRELLDEVLTLFDIKPDYDLNLMLPNQSLTKLTSNILKEIELVYNDFKPEIVLVHGDTTSCFSAALAAFYNKIPVAHVEAGLRTNNLLSPFPEESNRIFVDKLATLHFAPTKKNYDNLTYENINNKNIYITGNSIIDALELIDKKFSSSPPSFNSILPNESILFGRYILVTCHRRENFGKGIGEICEALKEIAAREPSTYIIFPVHPNPEINNPVKQILKGIPNICLLPPIDYYSFTYLLKRCFLILTDSGGIQEEAPTFGKPVLLLRDLSERQEALEVNCVKLVGSNSKRIIEETLHLLRHTNAYQLMSNAKNPFGNGTTSEQICTILKSYQLEKAKYT
jgi:UDP-N-acetylglucosamine 2-epimerase (non-hydrolysing)